jgi:hypothetical protein
MPLKVIGAGLGRTGTLTLKTALEMLGFGPCHHMTEIFAHPEQVPFWNRAADGEPVEWEEVFAGYGATVDWPSCHFYAELARRYPDAKVILSRRDPERWYESISETILASMQQMGFPAGGPLPADHPMYFGGRIIADQTFGFDYGRDNVIAAFHRHGDGVRAAIAPGRLLEFEAAQGWGPLCAFLGVAVPDAPFPRTNSREEFWQHAEKAREASRM